MNRLLILISMLLVAGVLVGCGGNGGESVPGKPEVVTGVPTAVVLTTGIATTFEASGLVKPKTSTVISSKVVGTIVALRVREGDRVRVGQLLAEIENREARAHLDVAQAGWREAQASSEEIDRSLKAALAAEVAAEANQRLANVTLGRYRVLRERKSVSEQEFDEVEARAQVAAAEVDRAEKMRQMVEARRQMAAARISQAQSGVDVAQAQVGYARITAPIDGIVTAKSADVGTLASPGVPLLTIEGGAIEGAGGFRLEVAVEQSRIGSIALGDLVKVRFDESATTGGIELPGKTTQILPAADPVSRTFTVRLDLPGNPALRSGLFGRAVFTGERREALLIPAGAVMTRGQLTSVYVVDDRGVVHLRLITPGRPAGEQVEVLSGLQPGEKIVTLAAQVGREGVQIK